MDISESEKEKYKMIWARKDYTSQSAVPYAEYLKDKVGGMVLEIGCGKGISLDILNKERGICCVGSDIVINGYKGGAGVTEAPAWDLPYAKDSFDYTFSTDVLEHIPTNMIGPTLREINRVTRNKTFHQIATFHMGIEHLTVESIEWWEKLFSYHMSVLFELTERAGPKRR
jgi:ubiquinone/menaquinone biosynthesis C-methylase UbiE